MTGQTWAHGATGSWQCIQIVGCVATLIPRSIKSTMIILSPLCESHSRQAASQELQPIQRDGSTNIVLTVATILLLSACSMGFGLLLGLSLCLTYLIRKHLWVIAGSKVFDVAFATLCWLFSSLDLLNSCHTDLIFR